MNLRRYFDKTVLTNDQLVELLIKSMNLFFAAEKKKYIFKEDLIDIKNMKYTTCRMCLYKLGDRMSIDELKIFAGTVKRAQEYKDFCTNYIVKKKLPRKSKTLSTYEILRLTSSVTKRPDKKYYFLN